MTTWDERDKRISAIIKYHLPDFIRDDHPQFVEFITSFIESQEGPNDLFGYLARYRRNLDVDSADDDFLEGYANEFAKKFPKDTLIKKSVLVKTIREFYLSVGSADSYKYIFNVLYNADVDVIYPRDYLYRPSISEYESDTVMYITGEHYFKLDIDNTNLVANVVGVTSGAESILDTVTSVIRINGDLILQLELSSWDEHFIIDEQVVVTLGDVVISERLLGIISRIDVIDGGSNYLITDEVTITDSTGLSTVAQIDQLADGPYTNYTMVNPGMGYSIGDIITPISDLSNPGFGFRAIVYLVGGSGDILLVRIEDPGQGYIKPIAAKVHSPGGGIGAIMELNGDDIGKIKSLKVFESGYNYSNAGSIIVNINSAEGNGAVFSPVLNTVFEGPKRYLDDSSTLSGTSKILDSHYYQQFSYVLASKISPAKWLGIVRRNAHPAGAALFGMHRLESCSEIGIELIGGANNAPKINIALESTADYIIDASGSMEIIKLFETVVLAVIGGTLYTFDESKFNNTFHHPSSLYSSLSIESISNEESIPETESTHIAIV